MLGFKATSGQWKNKDTAPSHKCNHSINPHYRQLAQQAMPGAARANIGFAPVNRQVGFTACRSNRRQCYVVIDG
jgi:hypothetical protein